MFGGAIALTTVVAAATFVVSPQFTATTEATRAPALVSAELDALVATVDEAASATELSATEVSAAAIEPAVPADSGHGRRIVFDQSDQRVWLVADDGQVERTYLVSGSKHDNLQPGSYRVQHRQRHAVAFDYTGTMEYFVQFTRGANAAIGFHTVPKDNSGMLEQTREQLGTPQSAGCVRQWPDDAIALWDFAPIGTPVVVVA